MPQFGSRSRSFLETCHPDLIRLGEEAIRTSPVDFSCTEGEREQEAHQKYLASGKSKQPMSLHLLRPSRAVHFDPYPVEYPSFAFLETVATLSPAERVRVAMAELVKPYARYYMLALHIRATAERLGIPIRWGGDWDGDYDITDQTFDDLAHFELRD